MNEIGNNTSPEMVFIDSNELFLFSIHNYKSLTDLLESGKCGK